MATADIGVYGLGTMGSALALNLADKGFRVAVTNRETDWIAPFLAEAGPLADRIAAADTAAEFVVALTPPRLILCMIPSGPAMDGVIDVLRPLLASGDTIIDGGNADFHDTRRRAADFEGSGLHYIGMGVSGGEAGARHGPSMMVGGSAGAWARLRPMAEAIAARFRGDPCVAHLGPDGAGHFVKTVHNGIEYADMQMIAETYGLLRDGAGWDAGRIGVLFADWSGGPLQGFLTEITARVLRARDGDRALVDLIVDEAGQKGTGRWSVIEALRLGQSASTIEAAVAARAWSSERALRASGGLARPVPTVTLDPAGLHDALWAGRIISHAQGFRLLAAASDEFGWSLDLPRIAEIWRAGCIIRSALLDDLAEALRAAPGGQVILAPAIRDRLARTVPALRATVAAAVTGGLPVPALSAALQWHDSLAQARGTTNLIQAQRDFFGHHGFRRSDRDGVQHGEWG